MLGPESRLYEDSKNVKIEDLSYYIA